MRPSFRLPVAARVGVAFSGRIRLVAGPWFVHPVRAVTDESAFPDPSRYPLTPTSQAFDGTEDTQATHRDALDAAVRTLEAKRGEFASLPIATRIELLRSVTAGILLVSERWAEAESAAQSRFTRVSPGEAGARGWLTGPLPLARNARHLLRSLEALARGASPSPAKTRTLPAGQTVVTVAPGDAKERLALSGVSHEVWFSNGVAGQGARLRSAGGDFSTAELRASVRVVMGRAGDASLLAMEALIASLGHAEMVMLALSPSDGAVGRHLETVFRRLIEAGYFAVVIRGPALDDLLARDPRVVRAQPDASASDGVMPILVAPGPYARVDLERQARNVASMMLSSFRSDVRGAAPLGNVMVARDWLQRRLFEEFVRAELALAVGAERDVTAAATGASVPPRGVGPSPFIEIDEAHDPAIFLARAVALANERFADSRRIALAIHPTIADEHEEALEQAIAMLDFEAIGINRAPGGLANVLLFDAPLDAPLKSVLRAPLRLKSNAAALPRTEGVGALGRAELAFEMGPSWGRAWSAARAGGSLRMAQKPRASSALPSSPLKVNP